MKILQLRLYGYKRLLLNNITQVEYNPSEKMQLIIGTNGSGKSSLLKELTPLPAIRNEYTPDGYKVITIEHNGKIYTLSSRFGVGHSHSLVVDDSELNTGGTFNVQKELVYQIFGITFDIHELLLSSSNFTSFSPLERRKWFTLLSDTDYEFALVTYQKVKDKLRDTSGAIKMAKARLVTHESRRLGDVEILSIKEDIQKQYKVIEDLLTLKTPMLKYNDQLYSDKKTIDQNLNIVSKSLLKLIRAYIVTDNNNISSDRVKAETQIDYLEQENSKLQKLYSEIDYTISKLQENNIQEVEDIDKAISVIVKGLESVTSKLRFHWTISDVQSFKQALESNEELLTYLFNMFPINTDKKYSKERYTNIVNDLNKGNALIRSLNEDLSITEADIKTLEHMKSHNQIDCPECHHKWIIGYDEHKYQQRLSRQSKLIEEIEFNKSVVVVLEKELEDVRSYMELYRTYLNIVQNWKVLAPLIEILNDQNVILAKPQYGITIILQCKQEIILMEEIHKLEAELKEYELLKSLTLSNKEVNIATLLSQRDQYSQSLHTNISNIQKLNSRIAILKSNESILEKVEEYKKTIYQLLLNNSDVSKQLLNNLETNIVNELISQMKMELVIKENALNDAITIQQSIIEIQSQIKDMVDEEESLTSLLKVLSPTDGLIGESIMGFIEVFITQINNIIAQIWSYPMEVLSCNIDSENTSELTYRFPVRIKEQEPPSPDVKKVSGGMGEMIDLAFKIVAMKYLGLSQYPLYMDEFGRTFDNYHRQSAMNIITTLLAQSDFTQLFLISHHESNYGSLRNTDINIMCENNIILPDIISEPRLILS
jgi:hypothetical protein